MTAIDTLCQDYIILGLNKSPGVCRIRSAGSPRKWDERAGYGTSGATLIYNGDKLSHFEVDIYIWDASLGHYQDWQVFAVNLQKAPVGTRPMSIGIGHPLLNSAPLSISTVVVEDVSQWDEDDYGGFTCTIKFSAYRAPLPALGKPLPGLPASAAPVPTAEDAADAQIQALNAQVQAAQQAP